MVDGLVLMDVELHDPRVPLLRQLSRPERPDRLPSRSDRADLCGFGLRRRRLPAAWRTWPSLGHRTVALLGAPQVVYDRHTGYAERTLEGFTREAARLGMDAVALPCEENAEAVHAEVADLLAQRPDLTGLVVHNEAAVNHVLTALADLGRSVPEDVSVVAICPDELAERARPALTSVLVPAEEVGRQAVTLLMGKIAGRCGAGGDPAGAAADRARQHRTAVTAVSRRYCSRRERAHDT